MIFYDLNSTKIRIQLLIFSMFRNLKFNNENFIYLLMINLIVKAT